MALSVVLLRVAAAAGQLNPRCCCCCCARARRAWRLRAVVVQVNVGKGGSWLLPFLCRHLRLDPARTAIVGDRMDTDIALGKAGGLVTILPLTGVTQLGHLEALQPRDRPDAVVRSIACLAGLAAE